MNSARWERIQSLFHDAADLPESERAAFLEAACGGDGALLADVLAMLAEDAQSESFLDNDVLISRRTCWMTLSNFGECKRVRAVAHRILGEGGMGVVYLAERKDLGNLVAIKVLRDAWLSPARRERFASEQKTLAQLTHSGIARLYDANALADGTPWFVMEYVEGLPLTEYCEDIQSDRAPSPIISPGVRGSAVCAPACDYPSRPEAFKHSGEEGRRGS